MGVLGETANGRNGDGGKSTRIFSAASFITAFLESSSGGGRTVMSRRSAPIASSEGHRPFAVSPVRSTSS